MDGLPILPAAASLAERRAHYAEVRTRIRGLLDGEDDWIAALATVVCELHNAFEAFDWTGFYRVVRPECLVLGPFQGGHGCLRIPFSRGICGAAARTGTTQLVLDVNVFPGHIACAPSTQSEIVVPVLGPDGQVLAVLDVDSNRAAAFDAVDQEALEAVCAELAACFPRGEVPDVRDVREGRAGDA